MIGRQLLLVGVLAYTPSATGTYQPPAWGLLRVIILRQKLRLTELKTYLLFLGDDSYTLLQNTSPSGVLSRYNYLRFVFVIKGRICGDSRGNASPDTGLPTWMTYCSSRQALA